MPIIVINIRSRRVDTIATANAMIKTNPSAFANDLKILALKAPCNHSKDCWILPIRGGCA